MLYTPETLCEKKARKQQTSGPKEIYYYEILEPYPINIEETNRAYLASGGVFAEPFKERKFCELVAENDKYEFYSYRSYEDGSGGYLLRREKSNPNNVVYFGKKRRLNCIFHNYLFQAENSNQRVEDGIKAQDVETGKIFTCDWLSELTYQKAIFDRKFYASIDRVDDVYVEQEKLVFKIFRKEYNPRYGEDEQQERIIEIGYNLIVEYIDNQFKITRE